MFWNCLGCSIHPWLHLKYEDLFQSLLTLVQVELDADFSFKIASFCAQSRVLIWEWFSQTQIPGVEADQRYTRRFHFIFSSSAFNINSGTMSWTGPSCWDLCVRNLCLIFWRAPLVKWKKSAVLLSGVQTYMLKISSGYTAKVENVTRVGSN